MKIKKLVEEIKETMPEGLNELEQLRYIYLSIGKRKSFDPVYYFGNSKTKSKICRLAEKVSLNRDYLAQKRELVCITISNMLMIVAKEFGIRVVCIKDLMEKGERYSHIFNKAFLKDGQIIKMDLQLDLRYIQTGRKTKFFGKDEFGNCQIDEDRLKEIDEKIGYKNPQKDYKDEEMRKIAEIVKEMKNEDAIEYVLSNNEIVETIEKTGYIEGTKYLRDVFEMCNGCRSDKIKISMAHCFREINVDGNGIPCRQYSVCLHLKDKKQDKLYLYKKKTKSFTEVSSERMARLMREGLKFSSKPEYDFKRFIKETGNWENIWNR